MDLHAIHAYRRQHCNKNSNLHKLRSHIKCRKKKTTNQQKMVYKKREDSAMFRRISHFAKSFSETYKTNSSEVPQIA